MNKIVAVGLLCLFYLGGYSQSPVQVNQSECIFNEVEYKQNAKPFEIISKSDSLIIRLSKKDSCCGTFKAASVYNDNVLKIIYRNTGKKCYCRCLMEFEFVLSDFEYGVPDAIFINNKKLDLQNDLFDFITIQKDTLSNGVVLESKYRNNLLFEQIEYQDSIRIHREFHLGKKTSEQTIQRSLSSNN